MPLALEGLPRESHSLVDEEFAYLASKVKGFAELHRDIPIESPAFLVIWAALFGGMLIFLHRRFVNRERIKYIYFLTDFWALILCLLPCYLLLGAMGGVPDFRGVMVTLLTGVSILLGVWAWLILSAPKPDEKLPGMLSHFITICSGGFVGWVGVLFTSILVKVGGGFGDLFPVMAVGTVLVFLFVAERVRHPYD